ncbi:MAG: Xaa-Pro peptidase family protein [Oenococcus sp.]|uniref:aminopeptidase P family protein n=1 Tax=Oenococcus TaxID=46254 RepID=UPI0021E79194|nr:Xaa-Pro peptidase family protein [Oenococcus kitaharae]MCV3297039.1 Xaa-Pro peptidase family protein [Oenococcus kitaharae]
MTKFNETRLNKLRQSIVDNKLDFAYISDFKTIQYLTTFGSNPYERILAMIVFADHDPFIFAPALEIEVVKSSGWPYDLYGYQDNEDGLQMIYDHIKERVANPKRIATEQGNLTLARFSRLHDNFPEADYSFDLTPIVEHQRLIKDADEIAKLDQAGKDADLAFAAGFKALKAGKTELQIAAELEFATKNRNVTEMSFGTLVQTAEHAADPHGETSDLPLKDNALVLFDLGTVYKGYISDASRTVALGQPTDHMREVHEVVLQAQLAAQAAVKPGVTAASIDKIARDIITKAGFGQYFIHRLGHGMGMSEHEYPSIMAGNDLILEPGMCFSIEPGVYIPGDLGVRIEDCIHVTADGCLPFTHMDKKLQLF